MKSIIKSVNKFLLLIIIGASLLLISSTVNAQDRNKAGVNLSKEDAAKNFCDNFSSLSDKYKQNIDEQITKLQERINNEAQKIQTNRQTFDNELENKRTKWEINRKDLYDKLTNKAVTDAQKQALAAFKTAVEAAVTARENAVDAARTAYREGVKQLIVQRKSEILQTFNNFKSAIESAIQQVKSNCSAGISSPAYIRQIYQQNMNAARTARTTALQGIDKLGPKIKELAQIRNAAVQQALQTYRSALKTAIANLKTAFGEANPANPTSSPLRPNPL
jgi:hypothetical protein